MNFSGLFNFINVMKSGNICVQVYKPLTMQEGVRWLIFLVIFKGSYLRTTS